MTVSRPTKFRELYAFSVVDFLQDTIPFLAVDTGQGDKPTQASGEGQRDSATSRIVCSPETGQVK